MDKDNETVDDVIKDLVFFGDEDSEDEPKDTDSSEAVFADESERESDAADNPQYEDTFKAEYREEPDEYGLSDDYNESDNRDSFDDDDEAEGIGGAYADKTNESYDDYPEPVKGAEYEDDGDEFDYDYEHVDEELGDTRLVAPMIKPLLKKLIPLFAVLLVLVWGMTSDNFLIKNYRENFAKNFNRIIDDMGINSENPGEGGEAASDGADVVEYKELKEENEDETHKTEYRTEVESDVMITFDGAADSKFVSYRDGVICAATNYICYINRDGVIEWEKNVAVTDPILRSEGDYFLLAQRGGNKFTLYQGDKAVYDKTAEHNILTGNVSKNGDSVLVTEMPGYKGALAVYNRRGDKAFEWSSGSSSIISADISPGSRRVAAGLMNTDGRVKSSVCMFNINEADSYARMEYDGSAVYKVDFKDENLTVFADNALIGVKRSGREIYRVDFGDSEVTRVSLSDDGDALVLFTGTSIPMLNIYNKSGKLKNTISSQKVPDYAYIDNGNVVYNADREIIMAKTNIMIPYKYTAIMDIKGIVPVDEKCFMVIYSNSISMVKMKGMLW